MFRPVLPEEPEKIDIAPPEAKPRGTPQELVPKLIDVLDTPKSGDFFKEVVIAPPVDAGPTQKIPLGPIGTPDGNTDIPQLEIINPDRLDKPPRARSQAPLPYPYEAKREGRSGVVTVEFTVDETGRVIEPRVVESTDRVFEAATLQGVLKWRFEPGRRNGRIVRFRMAVPVHFSLNE